MTGGDDGTGRVVVAPHIPRSRGRHVVPDWGRIALMHILRQFGQVFRTLSGKIVVAETKGLRYDYGMTAAKIAITLPEEQVARVRRAVHAGLADSVSGYIARALSEQERRESLKAIVRDLIADYGEPTQKEITWAKRALARRNRA